MKLELDTITVVVLFLFGLGMMGNNLPDKPLEAKTVLKVDEFAPLDYTAETMFIEPGDFIDNIPKPEPSPNPLECENCNGTGWIRMPDGHKIKCPDCSTGYYPELNIQEPEPEELPLTPSEEIDYSEDTKKKELALSPGSYLRVKVYKLGASWCAPCIKWHRDEVPILKRSNYTFGPKQTQHILEVDIDKDLDVLEKIGFVNKTLTYKENGLARDYTLDSIPTFIFVEQATGDVIRVQVGYLTATELSDIYRSFYQDLL